MQEHGGKQKTVNIQGKQCLRGAQPRTQDSHHKRLFLDLYN